MELECEKNYFAQAVSAVSRAINPRSPLPILSHILLTAQEGRITLSATDLDLGVTTSCEAHVKESGSVAVPAKLLSEIVSKLPGAPVQLKASSDGRIHLSCGRARFELSSLPAEEFPTMPEPALEQSFQVPQRRLRSMFKKITIATASSEESRAVMTGAKAQLQGGALTLVATDGRRMAYLHEQLEADLEFDIIVPGRGIQEIVRILGDTDEVAHLSVSEGQVHCQVGSVSLHCRLLEGVFPDYRRVLPREFQRHGRVGREALAGALQRMLIVAQEKQSPNLVVMEFQEDQIVLSANTPDVGIATEEIPCILEGIGLKIAFNGKYLLDGLAVLDAEEVALDLQDDTKSAVLREQDQENYKYVIMPVRLRELAPEEPEPVKAAV